MRFNHARRDIPAIARSEKKEAGRPASIYHAFLIAARGYILQP
jgi:hypothetical protein